MYRLKLVLVWVFAYHLFLTAAAAADLAALHGRVLDPAGAAVPNAAVMITNSKTGSVSNAQTDNNGVFDLTGLPPGVYNVAINKEGFVAFTQGTVSLQANLTATLNATMTIGAVLQSINVKSDAPGVTLQPTQQQIFESDQDVRVLDRMQMDAAGPVAGAAQVLAFTPGANVTGYGNTGATKYTITLNGINQGWGGYGGFTGGGALAITFDGVPIVDPATGLWQSPTIPEAALIQNTNVTYGPGDPVNRWYNSIGGSVEFTPVQPAATPHGDVSLTYGSYNQRNASFDLSSGMYHGWSGILTAGGGLGDDFRTGIDGFNNPSKDYAVLGKVIKSFDASTFDFGTYYAHSGGYRAQVIPTTANPNITMTGLPGSTLYSQQSSGFYSTLPYNSYNKYDTNEMALVYGRENVKLDDSLRLQNLSWYMHIGRLHERLTDVYALGPQEAEWNDPHTDTIGDRIELTKTVSANTIDMGAYYVHALYNSRNNFYNPVDGGGFDTVNIGGKVRSSYFNQDDFAIFLQDDYHPTSILHITPGLRLVGFSTGYSEDPLQDFSFAPGAVLSSQCISTLTSVPGNAKDQGSSCGNRQSRTGFEPSLNASVRAAKYLTVFGGFSEALRSPQVGGGGGLFQSVDPASYHLQRQTYFQGGFKMHFEGSEPLSTLLFGATYYHQNYSKQEIDIGLSNGDTIAANGASVYQGVNIFLDDDPMHNLHVFVNFNAETAKYSTYVTPGLSYNGSPVPYVPSTSMNAGAYYTLKVMRLSIQPMASFQFTGSQHIFDNTVAAPSPQTMASYGTLNMGLKIPFKKVELNMNALNVLNKGYNIYQYVSSGAYFGTPTGGYDLAYPGAPFTIYGGVTFHF